MDTNSISTGCVGIGEEGSNGLSGLGLVFDTGGNAIPAIPEPEIYAMMAIGLGFLGWAARRTKLTEATAAW